MSDMQEMPESEPTMGTGRLLGLFFGLAIVCAVFFGLGFALGHSTAPSSVQAASAAAPASEATLQPAAARSTPDAPPADASKDSASQELSFLKPSEAKEKEKDVPPPDVAAVAASVPASEPAAPAPKAQKPMHTPKAPVLQSGFVAQVAAVRRREDAETLLASLRKKNYPVFIASESPDRLFHVQVGPFADKKDAQAMKEKLSSDGYNSMVK